VQKVDVDPSRLFPLVPALRWRGGQITYLRCLVVYGFIFRLTRVVFPGSGLLSDGDLNLTLSMLEARLYGDLVHPVASVQ
jgi:hypothetical protein